MQVSVEEMLRPDDQPSSNTNSKTNFFTLADDGDFAIVRFLHQDINDFEVLDVHNIKLGGFNRKINCLRSVNGSKDECAICSANVWDEETGRSTYPLQRKFYIHLLRYENAQSAVEQIWERSKDYIKKLNQLVQDYGPLCDKLFKIVRHGAAGSMETTYDILPMDRERYNPDQFIFDRNQLNYKKALGTIVLNESNEAIQEFLQTGNFPSFNNRQKKDEVTPRPEPNNIATTPVQPTQPIFNNNVDTQVNSTQPTFSQPTQVQNTNSFSPFGSTNNFTFDGPRRRV